MFEFLSADMVSMVVLDFDRLPVVIWSDLKSVGKLLEYSLSSNLDYQL